MIKTRQRKRDSGSCAVARAAPRAAEGRAGGREAGRMSSLVIAWRLSSRSLPAEAGLRLGLWERRWRQEVNSELCLQGPEGLREGRQRGVKQARLSAGGAGASSRVKVPFRQHPDSPPLLASRLPGCTEEQICGVEGFQASHPSSTMNAHWALITHSAASPFPRESSGSGPGVCQGDSPDSPLNSVLPPLLCSPIFF